MEKPDRSAIVDAGFKLFLTLWSQRQNLTTPSLHLRMADWLEHYRSRGDKRLLLMAFRSSGKSTVAGLFAAWLLYRNPDLRIIVLAADHALATKMVLNVRRILERHPLTGHLRPDRPEQWAGDRFTVRRHAVLRDPSMLARGVTANITGSRADLIICDDVEVPLTCDTAEKREALRQRLSEISYVLADGQGAQLYIGTPHTYFSIYAEKARAEAGEEQPFLKGFRRLSIPLLDEEGNSVWPERFSAADIETIKLQSGPNKFASQMMLEPVNIAEGRLDPDLLRFYDYELDYARELRTLFLGTVKLVSASAWWDPAFGSAKGDRSVLAAVYADAEGNYYLHRVEYMKADARDETDEATQQCRQVAQAARELLLPSLAVETNGIGQFLPAILRNEMARAKAPCAVRAMTSTRPKDLRILEAFDAVLAARRLYVHESVKNTPFLTEMREWRPGASKGHDDGLDAVAGALGLEPVRLRRLYGAGGQLWTKGRQGHKAKTEFEV